MNEARRARGLSVALPPQGEQRTAFLAGMDAGQRRLWDGNRPALEPYRSLWDDGHELGKNMRDAQDVIDAHRRKGKDPRTALESVKQDRQKRRQDVADKLW